MQSQTIPTRRPRLAGLGARHAAFGLSVILLAACSRDAQSDARADTVANAGPDSVTVAGEASPAATAPLPASVRDYEVTDERYRQWVAAQRALDALPNLPAPPHLDALRVTQAEIDRAVAYLEGDPRARRALARAGLSARDYVLTTVALDQALVVASGSRGAVSNVPRRTVAVADQHRDDLTRIWRDRRFRIAESDTGALVSAGSIEPTRADSGRTDSARGDSAPRGGAARDSASRAAPAPARNTVTTGGRPEPTGVIPAGSTMLLQSDQRICTNTHKVGDRFTATVTDPVPGSDNAVIPAGAKATLTITRLDRSKAINDPITVGFDVTSISFGGITYPVEAEVTSAKVYRVRSGSKDAQKVAGGAIIGAIAGQVIGRDAQSTVIGAAAGAAAGTAAAAATATYDGCIPLAGAIKIVLQDTVRVRT